MRDGQLDGEVDGGWSSRWLNVMERAADATCRSSMKTAICQSDKDDEAWMHLPKKGGTPQNKHCSTGCWPKGPGGMRQFFNDFYHFHFSCAPIYSWKKYKCKGFKLSCEEIQKRRQVNMIQISQVDCDILIILITFCLITLQQLQFSDWNPSFRCELQQHKQQFQQFLFVLHAHYTSLLKVFQSPKFCQVRSYCCS